MTAISNATLMRAKQTAEMYAALTPVEAVALAGSQTTESSGSESDIDLYVYFTGTISIAERNVIASLNGIAVELNNTFWEPGDEWIDRELQIGVDVMFRSTTWIEDQLDRILNRFEASIGYSTCFWHNVLTSVIVFDRRGWFGNLQEKVRVPYPGQLRTAIIAKNHPILRRNQSSYLKQITSAVKRNDWVSVAHRVTAILASYFDILFAINGLPHPGEKRQLEIATNKCTLLPVNMKSDVESVIRAIGQMDNDVITRANVLLDGLDQLLQRIGLQI